MRPDATSSSRGKEACVLTSRRHRIKPSRQRHKTFFFLKPGDVSGACNPVIWEMEEEDQEFEANLSYVAHETLSNK